MIVINTVREHVQHGYGISCWCPTCRRFVDYSLVRLVMKGKGDKPLSQVRIRHACGAQVEIRRMAPGGIKMG